MTNITARVMRWTYARTHSTNAELFCSDHRSLDTVLTNYNRTNLILSVVLCHGCCVQGLLRSQDISSVQHAQLSCDLDERVPDNELPGSVHTSKASNVGDHKKSMEHQNSNAGLRFVQRICSQTHA